MAQTLTPTPIELDEARRRFGRMLLNWRKRYGWSGKTFNSWAAACPELFPWKVSSATWTGFELGRAQAPAPETFLAFELMNRALASGEVGAIQNRSLNERVHSAEAIRDEQGEPWRAGDFFDCFVGALAPPESLLTPAFDGREAATEARSRFFDVCKARGLGNVTALLLLLGELPGVSPERKSVVERAILNDAALPDAETAAAVERALDAIDSRT